MHLRVITAGIALFASLTVNPLLAEAVDGPRGKMPESTDNPKAKQLAQAQQPPAQPSQPQVVMPGAEKIVLLLRNTLITLNDAMRTGNFTVLRDSAAPGFRDANSAARLGQIFSDLASQGVDLSVASVISPQLSEPPAFDPDKGLLLLKGHFPGQVQINFEIMYEAVAGQWRVLGVSVNTSQPQASGKNEDPGE